MLARLCALEDLGDAEYGAVVNGAVSVLSTVGSRSLLFAREVFEYLEVQGSYS